MQNKVKVLMIGPPESGKTTLANFLGDAGDIGNGEYRPTRGARIVEFEIPNVLINGMMDKAEVELWDVSGDRRYANCWPAIQRGAHGVVFVYSPGRDDHPRFLESLHSQFVSQQGLRESQCLVFCHRKPESRGSAAKLSSVFTGIPQMDSLLDEESSTVRQDFSKFIGILLSHMSDMAERNETSMMQ